MLGKALYEGLTVNLPLCPSVFKFFLDMVGVLRIAELASLSYLFHPLIFYISLRHDSHPASSTWRPSTASWQGTFAACWKMTTRAATMILTWPARSRDL